MHVHAARMRLQLIIITEKYSGIEKHHTMDDGPRLRNERSKSEKEQLRCKVFLTNVSSPIRIAEMEAEGGRARHI